jgi:hypothetical protein
MNPQSTKVLVSKNVINADNSKRIFVVDPELKDFCGHHADYDLSIAESAKANGIETKILCNKKFVSQNIRKSIFLPCFNQGIWEYKLKTPKYLYRTLFFFPIMLGLVWKNISRRITPKSVSSKIKQIHFQNWTPPFLNDASDFIKKVKYDFFVAKSIFPIAFILLLTAHFALKMLSKYYRDLYQTLKREKLKAGDLVFFPMVIGDNFLESVVCSFYIKIRTKKAAIILLRYPPAFFNHKSFLQKSAWKSAEILSQNNWLRLSSDSHRLIEEFADITWTAFELFPIPHERNKSDRKKTHGQKAKNIGFLGNPRLEKGFKEFKEFLWNFRSHKDFHKFNFYIQLHMPDDHCRCDALVINTLSQVHKNIKIFDKALNTDEYNNLVNKLDVVLAIYDPNIYASRTSGVCMDAWSSKKSVILSNMPWAVDWMQLSSLTGTVVYKRNNEEITNAVLKTLKEASNKKKNQTFINFHNSKNLLYHILGKRVSSISENCLLYIYPWDDPNTESTGAGLVSCAILKKENKRKVFYYTGTKVDDDSFVSLNHLGHASPITKLFLNIFLKTSADKEITYRFMRPLSKNEKKYLNKVLTKCSEVVFNYPFLVDKLKYWLQRKGLKSKIYHYDLLYKKANTNKAKTYMKNMTFKSLNAVDKNCFVSEEELAEIKTLNRNGLGLEHFSILRYLSSCAKEAEENYTLLNLQSSSPFCLFFGSNAIENIEGAERFLQAASFAEQKKINLRFAIAGSVCTSIRPNTSNILKLGYLSKNDLYQVIKCASFCFFPMVSGSGISTKSSLALTLKKKVIGSELAFKGLGSFSKQNRIVISVDGNFPANFFAVLSKEPNFYFVPEKDLRNNPASKSIS